MPYATDAAFDAVGLRERGRGNCVAKASLLAEDLVALGMTTRLVSWEYELPVLLDVQRTLRFGTDVHTATQVQLGDEWLLVDATHDPALARLGLAVSQWDGRTSTGGAYSTLGPWFPHDDAAAMARLEQVSERIGREVAETDADVVQQYLRELNALFESARAGRARPGDPPGQPTTS